MVLEFFLSLLLVVEPCAGVVGLLDERVEVLLLEPRPLVGPDLRRVLLGQREGLAELLDGLGPRGQLLGACAEINQWCIFTKSYLGDDAAVLAPSSGKEPASPRHRAGVASMAWRSTPRFRTNAP